MVRTTRAEVKVVLDDRRFQALPRAEKRREALISLKKSKDLHVLERSMLFLIGGGDEKDIEAVVAALQSSRFQALVTEVEDRLETFPRIMRILTPLAQLPDPRGEAVLLSLAKSKGLQEQRVLNEALCRVARRIKKPSEALYAFLDREMTRDRSVSLTIVGTLTHFRTPEAVRIIAKHLAASDFPAATKSGWLHWELVPVRTRPEFLAILKQGINGNVKDAKLRACYVEALFDYRPEAWYGEFVTDPPKAPEWEQASTEVLLETLKLAEVALKQDIPKSLKIAVRSARETIEEILAKRSKK